MLVYLDSRTTQDKRAGDNEHAWASKEGWRAVLANQHQRGVRRSSPTPTSRDLLGQRQPHRWVIEINADPIRYNREIHGFEVIAWMFAENRWCNWSCLFLGSGFGAGVRSCYDEGKRTAETLTMDYHRGLGVEVNPALTLIQNRAISMRITTIFAHWLRPRDYNYCAMRIAWSIMRILMVLQVRIARIFNTYGPRMCIDDGRVVSNFVAQVMHICQYCFRTLISFLKPFLWLPQCIRGTCMYRPIHINL